jgi:hypothetical protein
MSNETQQQSPSSMAVMLLKHPIGWKPKNAKGAVSISCRAVSRNRTKCTGLPMRVDVSRLEEAMGHEVHQCDVCGQRFKYIPPQK